MTGRHRSIRVQYCRSKIWCWRTHCSRVMPLRSLRSPPVQKTLSPAPVSTTQRTSPASSVSRVHRSRKSRPIWVLIALPTSGRLSVTTSTCGSALSGLRGLELGRSLGLSLLSLENLLGVLAEAGRAAADRGPRAVEADWQADEFHRAVGHVLHQAQRPRLLMRNHLRHVLHRRAGDAGLLEQRDPLGVAALGHFGFDQRVQRALILDPFGVARKARIVAPFRVAEHPRQGAEQRIAAGGDDEVAILG